MRFRRLSLPLLTALLCAVVLPSVALAEQPLSSVRLKGCHTGPGSENRSGTFVGHMRTTPGAVHLAMHFRLIEETPANGSQRRSPDLGPWHTSRKNVERYSYSTTVNGMTPGDSYRVVVRFRWIDGSGNVIRRAKHTSAACVQPPLPNLTVAAIKVSPGNSVSTSVYRVRVSNTGKGPANKVVVYLYTGSHLIDSRTIKHLAGGKSKTVQMTGPMCTTVRAVVDPDNRIEESNENDNSLTRTC